MEKRSAHSSKGREVLRVGIGLYVFVNSAVFFGAMAATIVSQLG